ncbi:hypothetical protein J40TS1_11230 [Paenibacillus montaniterrae]|uniref:histidine kinase n=1 Tax=Paenibacillus montaniterrae TaxID=429341 RepID=A0A919YNQ7_9BACL|nr:HAMP domain-containing sensor histidine kinase [Paenibacillus montaniterrae]GIP15481.1 hypothetical protein J40TS1_11230 [Paenibacillus montaniterrae]
MSVAMQLQHPALEQEVELQLLRTAAVLLLLAVAALLCLLGKMRRHHADKEHQITQLQLKQRELQLNEQVGKEFVANVSHEVHASLASIQSYAQLLLEEELDSEQRARYAQTISEAAGQLSALTRQLLLLSRLENESRAIAKRHYLLKQQLRQVLQLYEWQLANKHIMSALIANDQSSIYGDQVLLQQVWSNLLSNAIKHTPPGGAITIEAVCTVEACIVHLSDTGEGIADELMPHIFDRYYFKDNQEHKEDSGSTGLGLSIAQKIVQLHGGTIHISSEQNVGTKAVVALPLPLRRP